MQDLRTEFIKILREKYMQQINSDIQNSAYKYGHTILITSQVIKGLKAKDDDDFFLRFMLEIEYQYIEGAGFYTTTKYVEYVCELDNGIKNLEFVRIFNDKTMYRYQKELSEYFLPYVSQKFYDYYADRFLKKYLGRNYDATFINVSQVEKMMNLKSVVSSDYQSGLLGKIVYKDCVMDNITEFNPFKGTAKKVEKGTIVITFRNYIISMRDELERSTSIHECLHWHFHRKAFEILMLVDETQNCFVCQEYNENTHLGKMFGLMEAQANGIMPSVLLNDNYIKERYEFLLNELRENDNYKDTHSADIIEKACTDLAYEQHVSKRLLKKRLIALGHKELINHMNENLVDDFVPALANRELDINYTRTINKDQLVSLIQKNTALRTAFESGLFVYANGYVILNKEEYVYAHNGDYCITNEARNNIEESTILFRVKKTFNSGREFSFVTLDRHATSGVSTVSIPSSFEEALPSMVIKSCDKETQKKFFRTYEIPDDDNHFSTYLIDLMDKYKMSINDLVKSTTLSESTIKKYRRLNNDEFTLENVLAICGGMQCKPYETKKLVKKAGFDITSSSTKNDVINDIIVEYDKGLSYWDDFYFRKLSKRLKKK